MPHKHRVRAWALRWDNHIFQRFPPWLSPKTPLESGHFSGYQEDRAGHTSCGSCWSQNCWERQEGVCGFFWGGEHGEAAGYFGSCKRGANSPAFIFQPAGADSGCFCSDNCMELSHRGLGYVFLLQLGVQQHFTTLIVLFLAAWSTGGAFRRCNKVTGG